MTVCPVCEHPQVTGDECEMCGRRFERRAVAVAQPVPVAALPELERTQHAAAGAHVPVERLGELDGTRHAPVPRLPTAPLPELDAGRAERVGPVPVERVGDLEATRLPAVRLEPAAGTVALPPGAVQCRYCRNVQLAGLLCDHCGMRLPRPRAAQATGAAGEVAAGDWLQCPHCHATARAGRACHQCGTRLQGGA